MAGTRNDDVTSSVQDTVPPLQTPILTAPEEHIPRLSE